jgi:hypothetical protein
MRFRTALSMATFFLVCFTLAVWTTPLRARSQEATDSPAETQVVSGKIASLGDAEVALEVEQSKKQNLLKFLVDGNTKIEGKLSVGAQATVEYRSEGGKNIASHISVTPASGVQSY